MHNIENLGNPFKSLDYEKKKHYNDADSNENIWWDITILVVLHWPMESFCTLEHYYLDINLKV